MFVAVMFFMLFSEFVGLVSIGSQFLDSLFPFLIFLGQAIHF